MDLDFSLSMVTARKQELSAIPKWKSRETLHSNSWAWYTEHWAPYDGTPREIKERDPALWWHLYRHHHDRLLRLIEEEREHERQIAAAEVSPLQRELEETLAAEREQYSPNGSVNAKPVAINRRFMRRNHPELMHRATVYGLQTLVPSEPPLFGGDAGVYYLSFLNGVPRGRLDHDVCSVLYSQLRRDDHLGIVPTVNELRPRRWGQLALQHPDRWKNRKDKKADPAAWGKENYPDFTTEDILSIDYNLWMALYRSKQLHEFEKKHDFMRDVTPGFVDDPIGHAEEYWPGYSFDELDTSFPLLANTIKEQGLEKRLAV